MLRLGDHSRRPADPVLRLQLDRLPRAGQEAAIELELKSRCAAVYADPAVRWLLGGELHPGGATATRRALRMISLQGEDRLLDVGCGSGESALLAVAEFGCEVIGVDYGEQSLADARDAARARGIGKCATFVRADAEALPFGDGEFDAVLCECSLCLFGDRTRAAAELHRVLAPGGRLALSDVVADGNRLADRLRDAMATVACVGAALPYEGYARLLGEAGFVLVSEERCDADAAALAARVHERLRAARMLGFGGVSVAGFDLDRAVELAAEARRAITEGALGYALFAARA